MRVDHDNSLMNIDDGVHRFRYIFGKYFFGIVQFVSILRSSLFYSPFITGNTKGFICAMYMMAHIIQQQNTELANSKCGNLSSAVEETRASENSRIPVITLNVVRDEKLRDLGADARREVAMRDRGERRDSPRSNARLFRAFGDALSFLRLEEPVDKHVEPRLEEQEQEGAQKIRHRDALRDVAVSLSARGGLSGAAQRERPP